MSSFESSIINLELPTINLKLIDDNFENVVFNLELFRMVVFSYFSKKTYPMLVDMSFLKFFSCCTFNILWGNDDTIENALSLYSLSYIVTHTIQIIWIFWPAIVNCHSTILNCLSTIMNYSLLLVDSQSSINNLQLSIIYP